MPPVIFRLPRLAYLTVLFLFFCVAPLAFTDSAGEGAKAVFGPRALLLLVPVLAAFFIARTATIVDGNGIVVRAVFGRRELPWPDVRGLTIDNRSVYAVLADGAVRMPCVRVADLASVARASGGRLPEIADPVPKFAPSRRRRR
ncbi:MAG TPA: PH domain-containing protein [Jatrophihabitantaceae bacterium]|nr:PH domain-containing protein [Jatrophihabitantaceae bacterium]